MHAGIPCSIGRERFDSKKDRRSRIDNILRGHKTGKPIKDPEDHDLLCHLLHMHPDAAEKVGPGIKHFSVRKAPEHFSDCFYVTRIDGTSVHFSLVKCLESKGPGSRLKECHYYKALRFAVYDQTKLFKDLRFENGANICAISKKEAAWEDLEVDHAPVIFRELADAWLETEGLKLHEVQMDDRRQHTSWTEYHDEHAQLRLILKAYNTSKKYDKVTDEKGLQLN